MRNWLRPKIMLLAALAGLAAFLGWRMFRPMNIFVVSEAFERPLDTSTAIPALGTLRAAECGACHQREYQDWKSTIHAAAWTDPYYQADWAFDGRQQVCNNCHTPLDRQQEKLVLGFRDRDKWEPVLMPNAKFDPAIKQEGVTCAGCHLREGKILGPRGSPNAPHPVAKFADPNEICVRCHVVQGNRWDTFYRMPPCGTIAEIAAGQDQLNGRSGEFAARNLAGLGCVRCHMPASGGLTTEKNGQPAYHSHTWRGGHDQNMVRSALDITLVDSISPKGGRHAELVLKNIGAAHFVPTGTPDRHLTLHLRAHAADGRVLREKTRKLRRVIMWRPFIVDLWDTRLPYGATQRLTLDVPAGTHEVEALVSYHLLGESRRKRIGYEPHTPISYIIFEQRRTLGVDTSER